jgi:hypothetical protein
LSHVNPHCARFQRCLYAFQPACAGKSLSSFEALSRSAERSPYAGKNVWENQNEKLPVFTNHKRYDGK